MPFQRLVIALLVAFGCLVPHDGWAQKRAKKPQAPSVRMGKLVVHVTTPGAEIAIDGAPVATAPMATPIPLTVGTHALKVSKGGYAEFLDTVKIGTNQTTTVEVDLLPFAAVLSVSSNPPGADVSIDGKLVGQTPLRVEVDAGTRVVRLGIDGYHDGEETIEAQAGESYQVDLELIALPPPPRPVGRKDRPIYKKWWFWAATGVIAIGATALVIGASSDSDPFGGADRVVDVKF